MCNSGIFRIAERLHIQWSGREATTAIMKISDSESLFDWLALERIPRVGPLTIARLIDAFGSPGTAMRSSPQQIRQRTGLSEKLAETISCFVAPKAEIIKDINILEKLDARVITRWDNDYPKNLLEIYDPPALLFVRGKILTDDSRAVGIVGTRNPTRYGLEMTEQITRDLARASVTVVSGLARGIDTACHRAALKAEGRTIGVLGCGIDVVYPRENDELIEEISKHGAVVSEFRPGIAPLATNFYRRNRIISGLAQGVVVVEAAKNSGSLITAHHALEQNRDVYAVPGNVLNAKSKGPHHLLKQGAGLAESAQDILDGLFSASVEPSRQQPLFEFTENKDGITDETRSVLDALDPDPVPIDLICESLKMDAGKISGILLDLELKGLVRQHPGKMFSRLL
jgi:DNA processing protein